MKWLGSILTGKIFRPDEALQLACALSEARPFFRIKGKDCKRSGWIFLRELFSKVCLAVACKAQSKIVG